MLLRIFVPLAALVVSACSGDNAKNLPPVEAGAYEADNVIIDHMGMTKTSGPMVFSLGEPDPNTGEMLYTGRVGGPEPSGPRIVYVFKLLQPELRRELSANGIHVKSYNAYLLPERAKVTQEALGAAEPLGSIDPEMSDKEILALFGLPRKTAADIEREELLAISEDDFDDFSKEKVETARALFEQAKAKLEKMEPDDPKYRRALMDYDMYKAGISIQIDQERRRTLRARKEAEAKKPQEEATE